MSDRADNSHAARTDYHSGGQKGAAGDTGATVAIIVILDLVRRYACRRVAEQVGQLELIQTHVPVPLMGQHFRAGGAEREVHGSPGAEKYLKQANTIR